MARVSVVMNCRNGEPWLRESIGSIFQQTYRDWELIFWDNASTDKSAEVAGSFGPKVRVFRNAVGEPLGKARDRALKAADGEFVAFLDADDLWLPRKLERQLPLFDEPKVALAFADVIFFDEKGDVRQTFKTWKPPRGDIFGALLRRYFLSMTTIVLRRRALEELGAGFDHELEVSHDKHLFLRLAHRYAADYVDEPLAKWRMNPASWTHRHYGRMARENARILAEWEAMGPEFAARYGADLEFQRRQVELESGIAAWKEGDPKAARAALRAHLLDDPRFAGAWAVSFLPPSNFERVLTAYQWVRQRFL